MLAEWFYNAWQWVNSPPGDNDWLWLLGMALVLLYLTTKPKKRR